jgi:tetratricopeptide (TPR) repeat protein
MIKQNCMKRILLVTLLWSVLIGQSFAGEEARIFAEGNKAYQEKDYAQAIKIYEQLLAAGWKSPELEYNLGNAWYRSDSPGRAIVHYERALIQSPDHPEALRNLAFLRSKITSEIEPLPPFFLSAWWKSARMAVSSTSMGITGMILWWLGFGALAVWVFGKSRTQKKWGFIGGIILLAVSLLPFSLALSRVGFEKNTKQAILIQKSAILRAGPEDSAQEIKTLEEGVKLYQVENLNGWWQVRLENGELGWLPEPVMERI